MNKPATPRILVVEDNELNMEMTEGILNIKGFEVDKAYNGKEAVDRLLESVPGTYLMVLMDIQMPVMNGYEASTTIRASGRKDLELLPIIAITADTYSDDLKKIKVAGMNDYIAKPIDIDALVHILDTLL